MTYFLAFAWVIVFLWVTCDLIYYTFQYLNQPSSDILKKGLRELIFFLVMIVTMFSV